MGQGSLTVVGSGIQALGQMTEEARRCIEQADRVLHAVSDPLAVEWITRLNPITENLLTFYREGGNRWGAYRGMVRCIHDRVADGERICAVFYGHPGVFVYPAHEAIRLLRREGFPAVMLPGISAEDCLFADLGFDPLEIGCQAFEATDFLLRGRRPDPSGCLVLWQVDAVGDNTYRRQGNDSRFTSILQERLLQSYPAGHETVLYAAAVFPLCPPVIFRFALQNLSEAVPRSRGVGTLFLPPVSLVSGTQGG
jgi:precorrin-6B methylase 1